MGGVKVRFEFKVLDFGYGKCFFLVNIYIILILDRNVLSVL